MKRISLLIGALALMALTASAQYTLPPLPYANNALEPSIDAQTMEIHHDRHHKAYVDNLNKAVAGKPEASMNIDQLVKKIDASTAPAIRNNAGGHWNHTFFWNVLGKGSGTPSGPLTQAINAAFGSMDNMKEEFAKAAAGRFGSGWAWLIVGKDGKLAITSTPNQDNPLMPVAETQGTPILGLDVWEHAYYLKYQNKRPDYVTAFWNVVNWDNVSKMHAAAKP
jgi:Fe-Mn family superoxide dismutase